VWQRLILETYTLLGGNEEGFDPSIRYIELEPVTGWVDVCIDR